MTTFVEDASSGLPVCEDRSYAACLPVDGRRCEVDGCRCHCREAAERARELDDRPAEALANIARDIDHEARAYPDQLHRERFPDHRELLAERTRRTA